MKRALMWVLWSPRNAGLTGAALVAVLVAFVVAVSATGGHAPAAATPTGTATTSASGTASSSPIGPEGPPAPRPSGAPSTPTKTGEQDRTASPADTIAAAAAAKAFTTAWLAGRTTEHTAWIKTLRPLAATALMPFMVATPAAAIPNTTIKTVGTPDVGADLGTVPVTLADGTVLTVEVMRDGQRWVVTSVGPA